MITVTLHFPHADFEGVEVPAVPRQGDNFYWSEKETQGIWAVSAVDWSASRYAPGPGSVSICLDPKDQEAHEMNQAHLEETQRAARAAAEPHTDECTCVINCVEDPKTACSLSGKRHVHPAIPGRPGVYGPCPEHLDAPGDH